MPKDPRSHCEACVSRRDLLKAGAAGAVLVAFPVACERPLPGESASVDSGAGGAAGETGGGATGSAGAFGAGDAMGSGSNCNPALAAGAASTITAGMLSIVGGQMVLGRDAGGLYAMSAICTHQGCLVNIVGAPGQQTLSCPCHGSAFDSNGGVTRGPARTPLLHYQVDVAADGTAGICTAVAVASTTRTPVP